MSGFLHCQNVNWFAMFMIIFSQKMSPVTFDTARFMKTGASLMTLPLLLLYSFQNDKLLASSWRFCNCYYEIIASSDLNITVSGISQNLLPRVQIRPTRNSK